MGLIRLENICFEYEDSSALKDISAKSMKDELFAKAFHARVGYVFQNPENQLFCGSVGEEIAMERLFDAGAREVLHHQFI